MFTTNDILHLVLLLSPIFVIQLGMVIYALIDLSKHIKVRGPRWAWALGLILSALSIPSGIIVAGVYLAWARHAEP
jgi:Zn-dependent protease with chaperone function